MFHGPYCHDKFVPNMDPCMELISQKEYEKYLLKYLDSLQRCYKLLGYEMLYHFELA